MDDGCRPDFRKNKEWFDIKLLSDGTTRSNTKVMKATSYTDLLRKIFKELGVIAAHYGHFGRVAGPVKLKFEELSAELIQILGNWDPKTQEARHSAKIPTLALRIMAGFRQDEGNFNPRTMVEPTAELLRTIWPWIEEELEKLGELEEEHITATATLHF